MVRVELYLPRHSRYVPVMRGVASCLLSDMHVPKGAAEDVQLALSEACGNVVRHAVGAQEYSVTLAVGGQGCEVEVRNLGPGFTPPSDTRLHDPEAEDGRGLFLMRALVDDLQFIREQDETRVRLVKRWPREVLGPNGESPSPQALAGERLPDRASAD